MRYVCEHLPFRTQVVVTREWDKEEAEIHTWLRSLTRNSDGTELKGIVSKTKGLKGVHKQAADSVMKVYAGANKETVKEILEVNKDMSNVIDEIFADRTKAAEKRADDAEKKVEDMKKQLEEKDRLLAKCMTELESLKAAAN